MDFFDKIINGIKREDKLISGSLKEFEFDDLDLAKRKVDFNRIQLSIYKMDCRDGIIRMINDYEDKWMDYFGANKLRGKLKN